MTTTLIETGWITEDGDFFLWTDNADEVDEGDQIVVLNGFVANILGADDLIVGYGGTVAIGIFNDGSTIDTENGNDTIIGTGVLGIFNDGGMIDTGHGNDSITGTGEFSSGIVNDGGMIDTGHGNDLITGTAIIGTGEFSSGIVNDGGMIDTGQGNDLIIGDGEFIGIDNGGMINTGEGNDIIAGTSSSTGTRGFDGGGTIDLGQGDDLIRGFGDQIVNGGSDFDTAELGFDYNEEEIILGSTDDNSIEITFDGATMVFTNVELFDFNGDEFTLEELQDFA